MDDQGKTHEQLVAELAQWRQRVAELEASEAECRQVQARLSVSEKKYRELYESMMDAYARDIAEHKQAEQALQRAEQRYRALFEEAPAMYVVTRDVGGAPVIADCNELFCRTLGFSYDELMGRPLADFYSPASRDQMLNGGYWRALTGQFASERELVTRDGRIVSSVVRTMPEFDATGQVSGIRAMFLDITERKRAEEALRESEERYRIIAAHVGDIVWQLDTNLQFVYVSPSVERVLGYSIEQALEMRVTEILNQDGMAQMKQYIQARLHSAEPARPNEYKMRHKDGRWVDMEVVSLPIYDGEGRPVGFAGVTRDVSERKRAEEALRRSQQLLDKTFVSLHDAVFIIDADTVEIIECNPAASKIFGYSRQEMLGRTTAFLYVDEAELDEFRSCLYSAIEERGFLDHLEFRMKRKNGSVFPTEHSVTPFEDEQGKRIGWVSVVRDITERKRAEEALRESEGRYHIVSELTSDFAGAFRIARDGTIMREWLTGAYSRITGFNPGEMDTHGIWVTLVHPEDMRVAFRHLQTLFSGQPDVCELRIVTASGEVRWLSNYGRPIWDAAQGRVIRIYSASQDITERKRAEETLWQSEGNFKALAENANDGILIGAGEGGWHVYANRRAVEITGYPVEELLKTCVRDLVHPDELPKLTERYRKRLAGLEVPKPYETTLVNKDGIKVPIEISPSKTIWQNEPAVMVIFRDITEHKRAEEEREQLTKQLRLLTHYLQSAREEERASIAREIHDEFGQALTALKMDLSWLSRRLPKRRADLLDKVNAMSELVDGTIRTVRRIATELRPGLLDDLGLVAAIEWQAHEFAERTGLTCELRLGDKDLVLDPDLATALFRILQESLTNIARHAGATRVKVELDDQPGLLTLVVRDNGKGIEPAQVFAPHSLGLMGMRERARVLGGDVVVEGIPGQGTAVTIRIPQTSAQEAQP